MNVCRHMLRLVFVVALVPWIRHEGAVLPTMLHANRTRSGLTSTLLRVESGANLREIYALFLGTYSCIHVPIADAVTYQPRVVLAAASLKSARPAWSFKIALGHGGVAAVYPVDFLDFRREVEALPNQSAVH